MNSLIVSPKDEKELALIENLFSRLKIRTKALSPDETEDLLLGELMKEADRNKKVNRETIMKKLR